MISVLCAQRSVLEKHMGPLSGVDQTLEGEPCGIKPAGELAVYLAGECAGAHVAILER